MVERVYSRTSVLRSVRYGSGYPGNVAIEGSKRRGLGDDRPLGVGVILISADRKDAEEQTVNDAEILQVVAERGVQALLAVQPLSDEGTQDQGAEPEDAHERHAERDDREQ